MTMGRCGHMNEKRISVRFNTDDEADLMIWNYLQNQPKGTRQNLIKIAVLHEICCANKKTNK